jgi:hypothetical protein
MASRVCLIAMLAVIAGAIATGSAARQPPTGTAVYVVRHDLRLCPSPMCGGYWIALANGARTRCLDGLRRPRCYVARALDAKRRPVGDIPEEWLVRGAIEAGADKFGALLVSAVYAPAGTATVSGCFYRVFDNGIRCIRAPCFSTTVSQVNGSTRTTVSDVDLAASGANPAEIRRAQPLVATKAGLYARGRFGATPYGGRVFRALRLYLKAPQPRA